MNTIQKVVLAIGVLVIGATVLFPPWHTVTFKELRGPVNFMTNTPTLPSSPPRQVVDHVDAIGPYQYSIFSPPSPNPTVESGLLAVIVACIGAATLVLLSATASQQSRQSTPSA